MNDSDKILLVFNDYNIYIIFIKFIIIIVIIIIIIIIIIIFLSVIIFRYFGIIFNVNLVDKLLDQLLLISNTK